jgi:hypothetical protein
MKKPSRRPGKSPLATLTFCGPPPLLEGEDEGAYNDLLAKVSGAVKAKDVLEEIWVRDVVDLTWEILRWRRLKAELMNVCRQKGLEVVLEPIIGLVDALLLAESWARCKEGAAAAVEQHLASADLSMESVWARVLERNLDKIERIDRMVMIAEGRRNAALREIERHRDSLAKRLREITDQVEDAEFQEITEAKTIGKEAA